MGKYMGFGIWVFEGFDTIYTILLQKHNMQWFEDVDFGENIGLELMKKLEKVSKNIPP